MIINLGVQFIVWANAFILYSIRAELLNNMHTVASSVPNCLYQKLLKILLYGPEDFSVKVNQSILQFTIKFLKNFEPFDNPLFLWQKSKNFKYMQNLLKSKDDFW